MKEVEQEKLAELEVGIEEAYDELYRLCNLAQQSNALLLHNGILTIQIKDGELYKELCEIKEFKDIALTPNKNETNRFQLWVTDEYGVEKQTNHIIRNKLIAALREKLVGFQVFFCDVLIMSKWV